MLLRNKNYCSNIMALFNKMYSRREVKFTRLLENLQVLLESDIILLVGKYSVWGKSKHFFKNCGSYCIRGPKLDLMSTMCNNYLRHQAN